MATTLLIIMGMMWGLQVAMLKLAARGGYSEPAVLLVALVLLSLAFAGLCAARGQGFRPNPALFRFLLVIAALGYVVPLITTLYAAPALSAGVLSLTACMAPVVAILTALALRVEAVSRRRMIAVLLGLASVVILLLPELALPEAGKSLWILAALAVPLCYGIESIYIARHWPDGLTPLQVVTAQSIAAAVIVTPLCLVWSGPFPALGKNEPGLPELGIAGFVAAGVIESLIYLWLIRKTGGVFVNFGTFVSLFAGIIWGMVLFAESHAAPVWAAAGLLILALALAGHGTQSDRHSAH